MRFFAEFFLSNKTRFFAPLRMTREGLRVAGERLNMKGCSWFVILSATKDPVFAVMKNGGICDALP
jgi:hypothetical protein